MLKLKKDISHENEFKRKPSLLLLGTKQMGMDRNDMVIIESTEGFMLNTGYCISER